MLVITWGFDSVKGARGFVAVNIKVRFIDQLLYKNKSLISS